MFLVHLYVKKQLNLKNKQKNTCIQQNFLNLQTKMKAFIFPNSND